MGCAQAAQQALSQEKQQRERENMAAETLSASVRELETKTADLQASDSPTCWTHAARCCSLPQPCSPARCTAPVHDWRLATRKSQMLVLRVRGGSGCDTEASGSQAGKLTSASCNMLLVHAWPCSAAATK